jgi:hypothetical protein
LGLFGLNLKAAEKLAIMFEVSLKYLRLLGYALRDA